MSGDEQQIRELVAEWARASEAGDLAAIEQLMDPEILFFTAGNDPFGRDVFRQHFEANVNTIRLQIRPDVREVTISGDHGIAYTWLDIRIQPPNGHPMTRTGYTLSVYRRRPHGRWRLWRDANLC